MGRCFLDAALQGASVGAAGVRGRAVRSRLTFEGRASGPLATATLKGRATLTASRRLWPERA
jgi:hypothetical protein